MTAKRFPKKLRLNHKKIIDRLFAQAQTQFSFPFKLLYLLQTAPSGFPPAVLISVPKRRFKKAVDRNRLKRQIRELYRLHKELLAQPEGTYPVAYLAIVYVAPQKIPYQEMERKIKQLFTRIRS
ncbi:MAG: ribonuclease P protein component [Microscillaceae bacterium]|nr:ribonuclease P protein component [Microscillaceae bacterium]